MDSVTGFLSVFSGISYDLPRSFFVYCEDRTRSMRLKRR